MAKVSKIEQGVEDFISEQLESIDEKIQEIDNSAVVRAAEKLLQKKQILMATRRALLGGNSMTGGSSGTRITQQDVVRQFTDTKTTNGEPVSFSVSAIAELLHTTEAVVRGHLNRGKDERFIKKGNLWYLRDPEAGVNSAADIEDEED